MYIQNITWLRPSGEISSRKEIEIILAIFSKYSLNTTKHLNFLVFKQAFIIYMENNKEDRDTVKPIIDSIKDNMNKLRTDFGMPNNHQVLVTEGWLHLRRIYRRWWKLSLFYFKGNVYVFFRPKRQWSIDV